MPHHLECPFVIRTAWHTNAVGYGGKIIGSVYQPLNCGPISILGIKFSEFRIEGINGNSARLHAIADAPITEIAALDFIRKFENALSYWVNCRDSNHHNGHLFIEFDLSPLRIWSDSPTSVETRREGNNIQLNIGESLNTHAYVVSHEKQPFNITAEVLVGLVSDSLNELYTLALRASTPQARFLCFFLIIERFEKSLPRLGSRPRGFFAALKRLFAKLMGLSPRGERLHAGLSGIGITALNVYNSPVAADAALCKRIVKLRNALAHGDAKHNLVERDALCAYALASQLLHHRNAGMW